MDNFQDVRCWQFAMAPRHANKACRGSELRCVAVVQSTESRKRSNVACRGRASLRRSTHRRVFRKPQMRSVLVVAADVLSHEAFQMPLVQNDHMIQQVPSAVPHPAFRNPFRHGLRKAVRTGKLPISLANDTTSLPNLESRSNSRNRCKLGRYKLRRRCEQFRKASEPPF
jgi:hypothetical protein